MHFHTVYKVVMPLVTFKNLIFNFDKIVGLFKNENRSIIFIGHISPCFCLMWRSSFFKAKVRVNKMMDFISQTIELSQLSCGRDTHSNKPRVRQTGCPPATAGQLHLFACYKSSPRVLAEFGCQIPVCDRRARSCLTHSCMSVCVWAPEVEQASLSIWATEDTWTLSGSSSLRCAGKPSSSQLWMSMLSSTVTLFLKEYHDTLTFAVSHAGVRLMW